MQLLGPTILSAYAIAWRAANQAPHLNYWIRHCVLQYRGGINIHSVTQSYNFVLEWMDDGNVAAQRHDDNSVSRSNHHTPQRLLRYQEATHKLIIAAVAW